MKQLNYIGIICAMSLITAPAVADIASAEYVDSVVVKYSTGNTTKAGITKLYTGIGTATDGTMTQSAINTALSNKQDKLPTGPSDGKKYSLIWNGNGFSFEEFTTGGGSTSIDWVAIANYLNRNATSDATFVYASYELDTAKCEGKYVDGESDGDWYGPLFGSGHGGSCSDSEFAGMVAGEWYIDIPLLINTKIYGRAFCSTTPGTTVGEPGGVPSSQGGTGFDKQYCWCKMTSPAASSWVYAGSLRGGCTASCTSLCVEAVIDGTNAIHDSIFGTDPYES